MRLGCVREVLTTLVTCLRFNEAEARAPRMLGLTNAVSSLMAGFNEAEARAPRMQPKHHFDARWVSGLQ